MLVFITLLLKLSWKGNLPGCLPDSSFPITGFTLLTLAHLCSVAYFHTKGNGKKIQQACPKKPIV